MASPFPDMGLMGMWSFCHLLPAPAALNTSGCLAYLAIRAHRRKRPLAASFLFNQQVTRHKLSPCIHHGAPLVQQVSAVVCSFNLVLHRMG